MSRRQYYSPKRRAIMAAGDNIIHVEVFERENWTCCLCEQAIDPSLRKPNPRAATLEHVIPLGKGGTHTWDNVRAAHANCNFARGCDDWPEYGRMGATEGEL